MKYHNLDQIIPHPVGSNDSDAQIRLLSTEEAHKKVMELVSGSWESNDTLHVMDETGKKFILIDEDKLKMLTKALRNTQEESFKLNLEKAILQHMPIDYDDVWAVSVKEIQKLIAASGAKTKKAATPEVISQAVQNIKKRHPNLFFNINDMIKNA